MHLLQEFVSELRRTAPLARGDEEMVALLGAVRAGVAWPALPARLHSYTRTRAYGDERFEVLLLNWSTGAASEIHDHGGQRCWFVVLDGTMRVDDYARVDGGHDATYAALERRGSLDLGRGDLDVRAGRFDLHKVAATSPALTLHVYAKPLRTFRVYDYDAQRCRAVRAAYDADVSAVFAGGVAR